MDLARCWTAWGSCGRASLRWLARALQLYGNTAVGGIWVTPYHYRPHRGGSTDRVAGKGER